MNIDKVTISGADDKVNIEDLVSLQQEFPFVEWGILVSRKREGTKRYPTKEWRHKLPQELNISYHLCGEIAREFVAGKHDVVWQAGMYWQRMQLNFSFKEHYNYLGSLVEISETASNNPYRSFILAYNNGSQTTLDAFIRNHVTMPGNIHFLYDSSGGRGTEIRYFKKPLLNYTGYAGGINPDNCEVIFETIEGLEWNKNAWVDMESGVRTNDDFDLTKVKKVLDTYRKQHSRPTTQPQPGVRENQ